MDLFNPEIAQNFWTKTAPEMAWEEVMEACDFGGHDPDTDSLQGGPIDALMLNVFFPKPAWEFHQKLQAYRQARDRTTQDLAASLFWCQLCLHPNPLDVCLKALPKGWALAPGYRGPLAHLSHRLPRIDSDSAGQAVKLLLKGAAGKVWARHESVVGVPDWIWPRLWLGAFPEKKRPGVQKLLESWEAASTPAQRSDWIRRVATPMEADLMAGHETYAVASVSVRSEPSTLQAWIQLATSPLWQSACIQEAAVPLENCLRHWRRDSQFSGDAQYIADVAQLHAALFPARSPASFSWLMHALPFPSHAKKTSAALEESWIEAIQGCPVPARSVLDDREVLALKVSSRVESVWISRVRQDQLALEGPSRPTHRRWRS